MKKSIVWVVLLSVFGAAFFAVLIGIAVLYVKAAPSPTELASAMALAEKDGIPLSANDVPPSADQNAAPFYDEWSSIRHAKAIKEPLWAQPLTLNTALTPSEIGAVQRIYDENADSNAYLVQAISKPVMYVPSGYPHEIHPYYAQLREAARETETKATLLALSGKWQDAARMQAGGFKIADQIARQTNLIGFLVALAIDAITLSGEQNLLTHSKPDAKLSATIASEVTASVGNTSMKRSLAGEVPASLSDFNEIIEYLLSDPHALGGSGMMSPLSRSFTVDAADADEAHALKHLVKAYEVSDEPPMERRRDLARIDRRADRNNSSISRLFEQVFSPKVSDIFSQTLDYGKIAKKDDEIKAHQEVLLAGAAVLSAKAATGAYPANLPGTFIDPFSGRQLLYNRTSNGFEVYSVGPTGKFNGVLIPNKSAWESTFIYPAPPPKPIPADELSQWL